MQISTYFSTGRLFDIAKEACKKSASSAPPSTTSNDALVAIVFATSTLEAFMSQAISMARAFYRMHPKIETFANFLSELDAKEVGASLKMKYYMAHWIICGKQFDRGTEPYQSFDLLVDLRNALIHLKPDKVGSNKIRNLLLQLSEKKLISNYDPNSMRMTWVIYISNPDVAQWSCDTAALMIQAFWKDAPEKKVKEFFRVHANAAHYTKLD